uniref:Uncharacterized protein n=1 Tax=Strigamia maritima TaxID=126957 RepID=T1JMN2_STRMM
YIVTTLVSVLCYINSLDGDFVHDDISAIKNNPDVMPDTNIGDLFRNDFWGRSMSDPNSHKSYRPITVLTFRFNVVIDGLQPYGFHVVNVILHALVTFLLLNLTQTLFGWQWMEMMLVGLLFAVHPIHTEAQKCFVSQRKFCRFAVSGIVGRADKYRI